MGRKKLKNSQNQKKQKQKRQSPANQLQSLDQSPSYKQNKKQKKIKKVEKKVKLDQKEQSPNYHDMIPDNQSSSSRKEGAPTGKQKQLFKKSDSSIHKQPNQTQGRKKLIKKKQQENKNQKDQKNIQDFEIFSDTFNKKIQDFKGFYNQYLGILKQSESNKQLNKVSSQVKKKIQQACINTLHNDIQDAQKWLQNQQQQIRAQIDSIEEGAAQSRVILQNMKIFSSTQIDAQLNLIKNKRDTIQQNWNKFQNIKQRAHKLYEWDNK